MKSGPSCDKRPSKKLFGESIDPLLLSNLDDAEQGDEIMDGVGRLVRIKELEGKTWLLERGNVTPNPNQPRTYFDPGKMDELEKSIEEHGFQQPITVVPYIEDGSDQVQFFIVDGERRFRASGKLGYLQASATVRWFRSEREIFEASLVLNEARADHNPIERASAYRKLIDYIIGEENIGKTEAVKKVGAKLGLSVPTIQNSLRLLKLGPEIQEMVTQGTLPKYSALQIASARGKFGDQLDEARVAALLMENPNKDFEQASEGRKGGQLTQRAVSDAIQGALIKGGVSPEEARKLKASADVIRFVAVMGQLRKRVSGLLNEDRLESVIAVMRGRAGNSQPPELVAENLQKTVDALRAVYTNILKPAIVPPLKIPEGKPKFAEHIGRRGERYFNAPIRYQIALILAKASDNDGSLLTPDHILASLEKAGIKAKKNEVAAIIAKSLPRELPDDLRVETHTLRKRSSRGSMEKIRGYRLAWNLGGSTAKQ